MKNILLWIITFLTITFWPLSLILANGQTWAVYLLASAVILVDWFLYLKKFPYHYFVYLVLPLIHPVFLIFPFAMLLFNFRDLKKPFFLASYGLILVVVSLLSYKTFYNYSIFTPDPLAWDTLNKKISFIPNSYMAKIFENRTTIAQNKFKSNFFLSLDLNNYFFSMHPREIMGDNQNLNKFPYLAIIPFLLSLFFIPENKHKKWLLTTIFAAVITLGFINNPDKFDILIFVPFFLLCFYGLKKITTLPNLYFWLFSLLFIPTSIIELLRIIVYK
jgi:hypothetical protein